MSMLASLLFVQAVAQVGSPRHDHIEDVTGQQVNANMDKSVHASGAENGDGIGRSVGVSGNSVLLGGSAANGGQGAVFVFTRAADGTYALTQKLGPDLDGAPACGGVCNFGLYQSVKGNIAVIGAMRAGENTQGRAFVYERAEGSDTWTYKAELSAGDQQSGDRFGSSLGISEDGNSIVVGAYTARCWADGSPHESEKCGAAYVFIRDGASWTQQHKFVGDDSVSGDRYGWAVDMSGDVVLIGAANHAGAAGALYVYGRTGTTWALEKKILHTTTSPATAEEADADGHRFGRDVGISGCESDATCTVLSGTPEEFRDGTHSGVGYLYVRGANKDWALQAEIAHSGAVGTDSTVDDHGLSQAVAISGDYAILSATGHTDEGAPGGSAYVWHRTGTTWTEIERLVSSNGEAGMSYARGVAIDGSSCNVVAVTGSNGHKVGDVEGAGSGDIYQIAKCAETTAAPADSHGCVASFLAGLLLLWA
jgi:hypothetical protein